MVRAFRFVQSSPVRVVREPVNLPSMVVVQKAKNELYEEQHNQCACGELSHSSYMRLLNFYREYHRDSWTRASSTLEVPFCSIIFASFKAYRCMGGGKSILLQANDVQGRDGIPKISLKIAKIPVSSTK